jgi:hypothetical protein
LKFVKKRNDDWGLEVFSKISSIVDCVLSDVGYHKDCYNNFCTLRRMPLKSISNVAEKITIAQTNLVDNFQLLGFKETIYKV